MGQGSVFDSKPAVDPAKNSPFDNMGSFQTLMDDPDAFNDPEKRAALRKNPYGHNTNPEKGGDQKVIDWFRNNGRDVANPAAHTDFMNMFNLLRGPHNPQGTQSSPYNMNSTFLKAGKGIRENSLLDGMTPSERNRYAKARYTYDNGMKSGLSNERTYERGKRTSENGPLFGGAWEKDPAYKIPEGTIG